MRLRLLLIACAAALAASALVVLGAFLFHNQRISPAAPTTAGAPEPGTLIARRKFSIPYGIDSIGLLDSLGQQVTISGHGGCEPGAETFKLRMRVTQGSNKAAATGATTWSCANADHWEVVVQPPPAFTLVEGPAEVCPLAIVETHAGGDVVRNQASWGCQEVTLVAAATS